MKTKFSLKNILKYVTLLFVCLVLSVAQVSGLSPFVYAFFFACLFVGVDEKLLAAFTLGSAWVANPTLPTFFVALTFVATGLVVFYFCKLIKTRFNLAATFISFVLSFVTYVYYHLTEVEHLIYFAMLAVISLWAFIVVLQVAFLRKNCFKITLDESICFLYFIAILGVGLGCVSIYKFELYRLVLMLGIYVLISTNSTTLLYSVLLSFLIGVSVGKFSLLPMAEFAFVAMLSSVFKMPNKIKIVVMSFLTEAFVQLYFFGVNFDALYAMLPVFVAGVIFVVLPNKMLNKLADVVYGKNSEISSRNVINITRKNLHKRMSDLSNVFLEMKQIHLNMVKKDLTKDEIVNMLMREVLSSCCKECLDKNKCTRTLGLDNKSNLEALVEIALTKGKVGLLDLPAGLTSRCPKVNYLVNLINRLADEYKQYKNMVADVNNVKLLLADQMGAVSNLLLDIGEEINTNVCFDVERENKIISRLLSQNKESKEVLLYTEKNDNVSAVCVVRSEHANNQKIEKILTETLKLPMQTTSITPVENGDFASVTLRVKAKADCVFGLATCSKAGNDECGDCHSIIRLGADKFLLALCDGMGSGKKAHEMSALTLNLIENFYKVGFDNDTILESVNKLLAVNNQETYSTLDVCLLDLNKNLADFIKVGAPFGVIKRDGNIEVVEGGALPIGALDSITPAIYKTTISTKDIIIMATDGIIDAFETEENLVDYVSHLVSTNPQTLAEGILNEALTLNEMSAKDDMTVLVARTYLKG
ncbi:MAG: SpoIIE family protein phosphatase [Clostridia bacterium]|nr:SpoIIE family protein phosphatase [Clostridia bacterium]